MDRTSSDATTLGQSGSGNNGNEGVLHSPQSSSITGASPSDCLVSYPEHSLVGVSCVCRDAVNAFCSPSRLGHRTLVGWVLPNCRDAISIFCSPSWLGHRTLAGWVLPNCRDAISILCSPSWLGQLLGEDPNHVLTRMVNRQRLKSSYHKETTLEMLTSFFF